MMIDNQEAIEELAKQLYQYESQRFKNDNWHLIAEDTRRKYRYMAVIAYKHFERNIK